MINWLAGFHSSVVGVFPHPVLEQPKNMFTSILPTVLPDGRAGVEAEEAQATITRGPHAHTHK